MSNNSDIWQPDVLVLGPGGMKGFLELGALIKFTSIGLLDKVHTYIGCSAGAMIALLLVAGYTPTEIVTDAVEVNIFQDITAIQPNDIKEMKENVGLISNHQIKERLSLRLEEKFGFVPNMHQLYLATGLKYIAVTLNLTRDRTEYLSHDTEPNLSCVEAAMLSMNIPFLFYKLRYRGCVYIDGAFGNPYPIDLCDDGHTQILGLHIVSVASDQAIEEQLIHYLYRVINSSMTQIKLRIQQNCSDCCKHLELVSSSIDTTGITFDNTMKSQLLISGYHAANRFIDRLRHPTSTDDIPFYSDSGLDPETLDINQQQMTGALNLLQGTEPNEYPIMTSNEQEPIEFIDSSDDNDKIIIPLTEKTQKVLDSMARQKYKSMS